MLILLCELSRVFYIRMNGADVPIRHFHMKVANAPAGNE